MRPASSSPQKRFIRNVPHLNLEQAGPEIDLHGDGKGFAGSTPGHGDSRRTSRSSSPTKHGGALLTPTSRDAFEKLRAELRIKNMEISELNVEIKTLKTIIAAKDIALQESDILCSTANEQLLKIRGEASTLRKELTNALIERDKLQLEYRMAKNEGELLDKASELEQEKLADRDKHITLVEKLRNDLAQVQKEMQQLDLDYKAVLKVIAAKDKALDEAFEKAERATSAMSELENSKDNAIGELKRRLTEAQWRIDFLQRQHEKSKESVRSPKPKLAATSPPEIQEKPNSTEPNPQPAIEIKEDLEKADVPSLEDTALESEQLESEWKDPVASLDVDSPQQTVTEGSQEDLHSEIIKMDLSDGGKDEKDSHLSHLSQSEIPKVDS